MVPQFLEREADRSRLRQLLENVRRNAVDHGAGVPEPDRERVFEAGHTSTESGTGFGLSIVQEIVDAHGWTITVTGSEYGGARFEITDVPSASSER